MDKRDWDMIYRSVGLSMALAWEAPSDAAFAVQMTALCRALWSHLRDDPFPDSEALANHLAGVKRNDPRALVDRLLNFQVADRMVN